MPRGERMMLAKKGVALPDGSFPIRNATDLANAVSDYHRAASRETPAWRARARGHIAKRAKALGQKMPEGMDR